MSENTKKYELEDNELLSVVGGTKIKRGWSDTDKIDLDNDYCDFFSLAPWTNSEKICCRNCVDCLVSCVNGRG